MSDVTPVSYGLIGNGSVILCYILPGYSVLTNLAVSFSLNSIYTQTESLIFRLNVFPSKIPCFLLYKYFGVNAHPNVCGPNARSLGC